MANAEIQVLSIARFARQSQDDGCVILKIVLKINLIYATDDKNGIAKTLADGCLNMPWPSVKEDFAFFKEKTVGCPVMMGYNTWLSLPPGKTGSHLLPRRENFILSDDPELIANPPALDVPQDTTYHFVGGFEEVEDLLLARAESEGAQIDLYVVGGASVYKAYVQNRKVDNIFVTRIHHDYECELFAPNLSEPERKDGKKFVLSDQTDVQSAQIATNPQGDPLKYHFETYQLV
jgi:dihydrofolate reductase